MGPIHGNLFVTRRNGVFKLELNSGLIDQKVIPGSAGLGIIVLPGGDMAIGVLARNSSAIMLPNAQFGPLNKAGDVESFPGTVELLEMKADQF